MLPVCHLTILEINVLSQDLGIYGEDAADFTKLKLICFLSAPSYYLKFIF